MREHPIDFFVELETKVWDALASGDAESDRDLLATDFVGIYPTGFADRSAHADQLADGPTIASYQIADPRLIRISASAVMLCYRADYRHRQGPGAGATETMYVSSLWAEEDDRWWNLFSQDTPAS